MVFAGSVAVLARGDAALGPVGRGVGGALLGHDPDGRVIRHPQGVEQAGNAASQNQDVEALRIGQGGNPRVRPG